MKTEIETNDSVEMTVAEETLIELLSARSCEIAGKLARSQGWPPPTEAQAREMAQAITKALIHFVIGMRHAVGSMHQGAIAEVLEGLARGAVEKTLGPAPLTN